jgi:hypothetical protein
MITTVRHRAVRLLLVSQQSPRDKVLLLLQAYIINFVNTLTVCKTFFYIIHCVEKVAVHLGYGT